MRLPSRARGFESLRLRHIVVASFISLVTIFFAKNHPALIPLLLLSPKSLATFRGPPFPVIKPISGFFLFFKSLIKLLKIVKICVRPALERSVFASKDRFLLSSNTFIMFFTMLLRSNDFQSHPHREESPPFPLLERTRFLIYSPDEHIY